MGHGASPWPRHHQVALLPPFLISVPVWILLQSSAYKAVGISFSINPWIRPKLSPLSRNSGLSLFPPSGSSPPTSWSVGPPALCPLSGGPLPSGLSVCISSECLSRSVLLADLPETFQHVPPLAGVTNLAFVCPVLRQMSP